MLVNAAKGRMRHRRGMFAALIRLLTIASFALMPLGMLGTPAMAVEQAPAASVPCENHGKPNKTQHENRAHCTSCVAIAEPQAPVPPVILRPAPNLTDRAALFRLGYADEVATPPPKIA